MKQCSLFCAGIWPFLLFPLLLLIPVLFFDWHDIEKTIASNAEQELSAQSDWVKVETYNRGREVLLTGTAPNEAAVEAALSAARRGDGVRSVSFSGDIAAPIALDPMLKLNFSGNSIVLNGTVASQSEVDQIVSLVKDKFSGLELVNKLKVGNRNQPQVPWNALIGGLSDLGNGGGVAVNGDELTVSGTLKSRQHRNHIESQLRNVFDGTIDNQLIVEEPKNTCESQITAMLASAKINFDTGSANIRPESNDLINNLAESAKQCPYKNFEISGHTDSTGSLESNMTLSELRAKALVGRLVELGLSADRFSAKGFGPNVPLADNSTATGRAANRRLEFKVTN